MNKHTAIVIIASVVIIISIGFSAWNLFSTEQVQFKTANPNFKYFDLINNGKITMCNPLPLSASFNSVSIKMIYEGREIGTFDMSRVFLESNSETEIQGKFSSESFKESQYLSLHFDGMYNNVIPTRINVENMNVITQIQTNVIGVIPYAATHQYHGLEFWKMMEDSDGKYRC